MVFFQYHDNYCCSEETGCNEIEDGEQKEWYAMELEVLVRKPYYFGNIERNSDDGLRSMLEGFTDTVLRILKLTIK